MSKKLLLGKEKKVKTEDKSSFTYAAAEAALADKKTFDFDGKEYPVEITKEKAKEIVNEEYELFMEQTKPIEPFDISPLQDYVNNKAVYKNMKNLASKDTGDPALFEKIVQTTIKFLQAVGITPPSETVLRSRFAARQAVPEIRELQRELGVGVDGKVGPDTFSAMISSYERLEKKKPPMPAKSWSELLADFNRQVATVKTFFGNIPKNWLEGLANSIGMISSSSGVAGRMMGILQSLGLVAIPLSVVLAVGLAGRFGWRRYVRSREKRQLARMFANDNDIYKILEAKAQEAVKDIPDFDKILLKEIIRKTEAAEKRFGI